MHAGSTVTTKLATIATSTVATLALTGAVLAVPAASSGSPARNGVCAGVQDCRRVATIDVDGDRRADRVGWHRINKKRVQIRVRTAKGRLLRREVNVRYWWRGGKWGGAAWIDGRPGAGSDLESYRGADMLPW